MESPLTTEKLLQYLFCCQMKILQSLLVTGIQRVIRSVYVLIGSLLVSNTSYIECILLGFLDVNHAYGETGTKERS